MTYWYPRTAACAALAGQCRGRGRGSAPAAPVMSSTPGGGGRSRCRRGDTLVDAGERSLHVLSQFQKRQGRRPCLSCHQIGAGSQAIAIQLDEHRPYPAPKLVPFDSMTHPFPDGECQSGLSRAPDWGIGEEGDADRTLPGPHTRGPQRLKGRPVPNAPDQADRRWRPFRRRARTTARPPRSDMRCRNPWRLARRRLFGWNVRFTAASSVPDRRSVRTLSRTLGSAPGGALVCRYRNRWTRPGHRYLAARKQCRELGPGMSVEPH